MVYLLRASGDLCRRQLAIDARAPRSPPYPPPPPQAGQTDTTPPCPRFFFFLLRANRPYPVHRAGGSRRDWRCGLAAAPSPCLCTELYRCNWYVPPLLPPSPPPPPPPSSLPRHAPRCVGGRGRPGWRCPGALRCIPCTRVPRQPTRSLSRHASGCRPPLRPALPPSPAPPPPPAQ